MSIESVTSKRYEIKFVSASQMYPHFLEWVRRHPFGFREAYPVRQVNNVYFDTMNYQAYQANLSGISRRHKVRYRWYGDSRMLGSGRLEIKCKRGHLSWKKVFPIDGVPSESGETWSTIQRFLSEALPDEGRLWLKSFPQPVLMNHYMRRYLVSQDRAVRVTFDEELRCTDQRYKPTPNFSNRANLTDMFVLEMKVHERNRDLCRRVAATLPMRVSRNSKYVQGVQASRTF